MLLDCTHSCIAHTTHGFAMKYLGILGLSAPTQLVEEAVPTLCNRLLHATLASDRRSAILGLKSFSRQYRETVAEYGLRPLVATLVKEYDSEETARLVLETLLILFIRGESSDDTHTRGWISHQSRIQNGKYPSPLLMETVSMDQFLLWISDELTKDTETVSTLINVLGEHDNFYIRLYALQILESMVATRAVKTRDTILKIPTSILMLVSLLQDPLEPVRNEAILLLMALVNSNFQIQKLVAFENTFERLFDIIDEEGGIRGSILVQDCLSLICNLLQFNASNQKFFLETLCVPRLAKLISEPVEADSMPEGAELDAVPEFAWNPQRIQNITIALDICSSFAAQDNELKTSNQSQLFKAGIQFAILRLVFSLDSDTVVRSAALAAIADLIAGNATIQDEFSRIDVPYIDPTAPSHTQVYSNRPVYICLLNWCLFINSVHFFELRMGAAQCLHAFFQNNSGIKRDFIDDQIKEYHKATTGQESDAQNAHTPCANIFLVLMEYSSDMRINPYRTWFAAVILLYIFEDSDDLKQVARSVKTGDENAGEEVMSSISAISGLLLTSLELTDHRAAMGYLMLLTYWLFADFDAVCDFLSDPSVPNALLAYLANNSTDQSSALHGMTTILLGVAYEFSTQNSAVSRADLHTLLQKALGQENYTLTVKQFKNCPSFKNFDEDSTWNSAKDDTGLPQVYFDAIYVSLVKENFTRIKKSLFHDPQREPHGHLTYEMLEELDHKLQHAQQQLQLAEALVQQNQEKLSSEISARTEAQATLENTLEKVKAENAENTKKLAELTESYATANEQLEKCNAEKKRLEELATKYFKELKDLSKSSQETTGSASSLKTKLDTTEQAKKKLEDGINKMTREMMQMSRQKTQFESTIKSLQKKIDAHAAQDQENKRVFEAQLSNVRLECERAKTNLAALASKFDAASKQNLLVQQSLEQKAREAQDTSQHLMDKLRAAAAAFQELKKRDLSGTAADSLQQYAAQIAAKDRKIDELLPLVAQVKTLEADIGRLATENTALRTKLNTLGHTILHDTGVNAMADSALPQPVQNDEELLETMENASESPNDKVEHTQMQIPDLNAQLASREVELVKKAHEYSQLEAKLASMCDERDNLRTTIEENQDTISRLQESVHLAEKLLKDEHEKLETLKREFENARAEADSNVKKGQIENDEVKSSLAAAVKRAEMMESDLDKVRKELVAEQSHVEQQTALIRSLEEQKAALEQRLQELEKRCAEHLTIRAEKQRELDELSAQRALLQEKIDLAHKELQEAKEEQIRHLQENEKLCVAKDELAHKLDRSQQELETQKNSSKELTEIVEQKKAIEDALNSQRGTSKELALKVLAQEKEIKDLRVKTTSATNPNFKQLEKSLAHYEENNNDLRSLLEMLKTEVERCHIKIASLEKDGLAGQRPSLNADESESEQKAKLFERELQEAQSREAVSQDLIRQYASKEEELEEQVRLLARQLEALQSGNVATNAVSLSVEAAGTDNTQYQNKLREVGVGIFSDDEEHNSD